MAGCLPQVDGNRSSKCLCVSAPMDLEKECVHIYVSVCVSVSASVYLDAHVSVSTYAV